MRQKLNEFTKWDTHHHINPSFYEAYVRKHGHENVFGLPHPKWSPKMMLGWMDEINIEKSVMSISTPGVHFGDDKESRKLCRQCNDYMSELIKENPNRLGAFGVVPLPDVNGAVEELIYALDHLKFDGIGLLSNLNHHYLGDEKYEAFYEEANKREAVIYIHPTAPEIGPMYSLLNYTYYFKLDTAKTIIDFMRSGYHKKYSKIRFILSHGGGVLPAIFETVMNELKKENPNIQEEFEVWRSQLFADTSLITYADETLATTLEFFGANHVIFGSDLCWGVQKYKYFIGKFSELDVSKEVFEDIYHKNAKALFSKQSVKYKPFNIKPESSKRNMGSVNYHSHLNPKDVVDFVTENTGLSLTDVKTHEIITQDHDKSMLSLDIPELWSMNKHAKHKALRIYNDSISSMNQKSTIKAKVLAAIDSEDVGHSIEEIDYCLKTLKMDGICLYVNVVGKKYEEMFDTKLLQKLELVNVPIVIHPKASAGIPLYNEQYFDTVAYMFSLIYQDHFEHMTNVNYIPTHTGGLLDFLSHPISTMHYIDPLSHKPRIGKVIWEMMIKKKELVHDYIKELEFID